MRILATCAAGTTGTGEAQQLRHAAHDARARTEPWRRTRTVTSLVPERMPLPAPRPHHPSVAPGLAPCADGRNERSTMTVATRTVRIGSAHGLHARPAKLFAQGVKDSGLEVTISKGAGAPVNAASILGVISLGAEKGDYVTLTAEGENANAVLDVLAELLTTDHDDN